MHEEGAPRFLHLHVLAKRAAPSLLSLYLGRKLSRGVFRLFERLMVSA
jgi:hypothetical protein